MEMSLTMARQAVADGISISLLTPHHLNGIYANPAQAIREQVHEFRSALDEAGIELDVLPGAECHLVPELPGELRDGTAMTVADRGKAVLVELPVHNIPMGATTVLEDILGMGVTPIIVHPERNSELCRHPERLADWVELGCLAQVTSRSCTGKFGDQAFAAAKSMVTSGAIHFVASDAHRDHRRIPEMSPGREMIAKWAGEEVARLLAEEFPRALVLGRPVETGHLADALAASRPRWKFWQSWA